MNEPRGVFWRIAAGSLAGALFLFAGTASIGLYLLHRQLSPLFETLLRNTLFQDASRFRFDRAGVDLLRGRVDIEGFSVAASSGPEVFSAGVLRVSFPLMASDGVRHLSVSLKNPVLRLGAAGGPASGGIPLWAAPLARQVPVRTVGFSDGVVEFQVDEAVLPFRLEGVDGLLQWNGGSGWDADVRARFPTDPPGDVKIQSTFQGRDGEVDVVIRNLPWAYLAERLSAPGEDIRFLSGVLGVKGSVVVRDGLLTANPLVDIRGLALEVPEEKKKFAGFSVKKIQSVLEVGSLSFTVPVNGRWEDPNVGFAVVLEQVLQAALRDKIPEEDKRAKLARRGGRWLGGKADRAFKEWLAGRKGDPSRN